MPQPRQHRWSFSRVLQFAVAILAMTLAARYVLPVQAATPTDLFFSEYIEGSSNNKALEIYNGTGAPVDLTAGGYNVQVFFNGSATSTLTINLAGTVAAGDVYVVGHSSAVAAILDQADLTNGSGWFNGDDAVVLRKGDTVIDSIGQIGTDPGSQWGTDLTSTADNTLRRQATVCQGDTDPTNAFDPAVEWDGFAQDTFDGLGSHTATCGSGPADPVLNEFVFNHAGTDTAEFVEVLGSPNTDYSTLTLLEIEGDSGGTATGTVDEVITLTTTDANGYWTTSFLNNAFENGTVSLLLVEGFTSSAGSDLDTNDDGILDAAPWTRVVDDVAVSDGGSGDLTYAAVVLTPDYDGGSFAVGGASRIPNGTDTNVPGDWVRNDYDGEGLPGLTGTPTVGEAYNTPGAENTVVRPPAEACGDAFTPIYAIQGSGDASPLAGQTVSTEGVVVGDFQSGDGDLFDTNLNGFYIQAATGDGDPATSDGVFVYAPGAADVNVGDLVRVKGAVSEYNGLTELGVSTLWSCSTGTSVAPTAISMAADAAQFERYEGMWVTFPEDLTISEYFNYDRYGELVLTPGRQNQPTAVVEPGPDAIALAAANAQNRITLDDGRSIQNPALSRHPNGAPFALDNRFRGGDIVRNLTGVMDYQFSLYRIQPTTGADYIAQNPRTAAPDAVGGSLQVASFNVLNYFLSIDTGVWNCGPSQDMECRGADTTDEFNRQRAKILSALTAINADVFGLIEMENTPGVEPLADLVNGLNATMGAGAYAYLDTGVIGTDAIRVGIIYKPGAVTPAGSYAVLDSTVDPRFIDTKNRPALAQTFDENATGARFTVVVNHLKSKGSDCLDVSDPDTGDGAGNCNITRTNAAAALVDWLATDPTTSGDPDFLIIGDLNSYDKEDPIDAIRAGADDSFGTADDYTDLAAQFEGEYAYSYVFDGQVGYLDHALAVQSLASQVSGVTDWHINADEPDILDYDMTFKPDAQDALYEPNAYRASDHDPVIIGLNLTIPAQPVVNVHYRYWRSDRQQGTNDATLFDDGTFTDSEGRSGVWQAALRGKILALAYPQGVNCGAVLVGDVTRKLKYVGLFACSDNIRLWGIFQGNVDATPPVVGIASTDDASATLGLDVPAMTSLCAPDQAELRAWMAEQGAELAPCHTLTLPMLTR